VYIPGCVFRQLKENGFTWAKAKREPGDRDPPKVIEYTFTHPSFQRGKPQLLVDIKRLKSVLSPDEQLLL
jgi:hypothetical protein